MYDIENSLTSVDIINCARFYWYLGDNDKFDELIEKVLFFLISLNFIFYLG